jgi:hypothetical protein
MTATWTVTSGRFISNKASVAQASRSMAETPQMLVNAFTFICLSTTILISSYLLGQLHASTLRGRGGRYRSFDSDLEAASTQTKRQAG